MKNVASATNKGYYIIILSNLMLFGIDDDIKTERFLFYSATGSGKAISYTYL